MTPREEIDALAAQAKEALEKAAAIGRQNDISFEIEILEKLGAGIAYVDTNWGGGYTTLEGIKDEAMWDLISDDRTKWSYDDRDNPAFLAEVEQLLADRTKEWTSAQQVSSGTLFFHPNSGFSIADPWVSSSLNC